MIAAPRSRNDPCPCGSGARYKHCHGAPDAQNRTSALEAATAEARFYRANELREKGDAHAAIAEYERALELDPDQPALLNNLGLALEATGEHGRAEQCYRKVLASHAQHPDALGNFASVLFEREDYAGAVAAYERLFTIRHDASAAVWVRRAIAQQKTGALDAAEASFREAAARAPDDPRIHANLGTLLVEERHYAAAEPALLRTLELDPRHGYALSMLAHARQQRCAWSGIEPMFVEINRMLESGGGETSSNINPFTVLAMPVSPLAQLRAAQRWAAGLAPAMPALRPDASCASGERLRVGFVSSDFREHAVARVTAEFFETIDRRRIETFGYALLPHDGSRIGRRIVDAIEHFSDVSGAATETIAGQIRTDHVTILIDLNGYTVHDRARLFALRPAPVQINWLGYLGTLGADWVDYVLTDHVATPDEQQASFSERFLHLPDCFFPGDTQREVASVAPSRGECQLPADSFVFCCFNNQYKILPAVFDIWMRLLAHVPRSVLWLSAANDEAMVNLRREAAMRSIDPARLVFAPRVSSALHLARHCHADLFLDTAPYNAGVTANDALWMGVPVVTCAGNTMASRVAGSQLHAIGLSELVTSSFAEYEMLALRLAQNPKELAALSARLAANRRTHPLFDSERFTRGFEEALFGAFSDQVAVTAA